MPSASLWALVIAIGLICFKLTLDLAGAKRELKDGDERIHLLTAEREKIYNDYQDAEEYFRQTLETELRNLKDTHLKDMEKIATISAEYGAKTTLDKIEEGIAKFEQGKASLASLIKQPKNDL